MAKEKLDKLYRMNTVLYYILLVVQPVIILAAALFIRERVGPHPEFNPFVLYMLLVVAGVIPAIFPLIRRVNLSKHSPRCMSDTAAAGLYSSLSIMLTAMISTAFIIGMVCFLISGEIRNLLYFYPIGIAWTWLRRPRRETFDRFVEEYGGAN